MKGLAAAGLTAMVMGLAPAALAAPAARPAFFGHEVYKIVTVLHQPKHPVATARGAFHATGAFYRRHATLAFPKGRIKILRNVTRTTMSGPNLATCGFGIIQTGTFRVTKATGKYRGLRETGTFVSRLHGKYNRTGPGRCGKKLVAYRVVTYERGIVR
jgi:hypothetical protein